MARALSRAVHSPRAAEPDPAPRSGSDAAADGPAAAGAGLAARFEPRARRPAWSWLLLLVAAGSLIWHSLRYDFVTDDAYISFVYARNLAEHGQLTFNLGDHVEGYSNFSWTVILGGLMALGIGPELAARVLGTVCGVLALVVAFVLTERATRRGSTWAALPPLLLACSSGFACWSSGGLETQLFTLLCLLSIERFAAALGPGGGRAPRAAPGAGGADAGDPTAPSGRPRGRTWAGVGVLLALAAMTRPEGLLLAAVLAICAVVGNVLAARAAAPGPGGALARLLDRVAPPAQRWAMLAFLALWAPWLGWRLWYYGWPFPNTYYVKAHGPWQPPELAAQMWRNGGYYLWTWLQQTELRWGWPLALVGLFAARPRSARFAVTAPMALFAAAYLGYAASVGGDFMGLHRFIMPVFAIAAVAVALGLRDVLEHRRWVEALTRWPALRRALAAGIPVALLLGFAVSQRALTAASLRWGHFEADRGIDTPAYLIAYTEDRAAIGRALRGCLRPDDLSIVGGAGAQPYVGRMRAIDVFGLVSDRVAHRAPRIRARAGHTKWASDALLLEYDPTFVFSCYAIHAAPTPPPLGCAAAWLERGYRLVTLRVPDLKQAGPYYTFLAKQRRAFTCPGLVR